MLLSLVAMTLLSAEKPVLAGYLPAWKMEGYELSRLAPLTDVLYFSIQPTENGGLDLKDISLDDLPKLAAAKKRHGFRLLICFGGWERSQGFMPTASDPAKRARFVKEAATFCEKYGFDSLDLDWEHPKDEAEAKAYGALIKALRAAFTPKKWIVTAAIASWQAMAPDAVSGLDRVHLMSYDHEDKHATMEKSKADVDKLVAMGFPLRKIVLGVPFYGRSLKDWNTALGYSEIFAQFKPESTADEAGGYYFNGQKLLGEKAAFVKEKGLGGMMIWEITQDVAGKSSLLHELKKALTG